MKGVGRYDIENVKVCGDGLFFENVSIIEIDFRNHCPGRSRRPIRKGNVCKTIDQVFV
jgi:hypothetical protein